MNEKSDFLHQQVSKVLATFRDPSLQKTLIELQALQRCTKLDRVLHIELLMPFAWNSTFLRLKNDLEESLLQVSQAIKVKWEIHYNIPALRRTSVIPGVKGVRNILAISSGKGGVGKSCTAVNLALALHAEGAKVGLLDADIYGPSIPSMLGTALLRPSSPDGKHIEPIMAHQLATNSIGYLSNHDDDAMIWRGPMASKALLQLLQDTLWPDLDYLLIDMPPGTGDIQLTLAQSIPVTACIIVTTPQEIALLDVKKGIGMFQKTAVPILGVIENMSMHTCTKCGYQEAIFGSGGAEQLLQKYQINLLAQLPLDINLREDLDKGEPTMIRSPNSTIALLYRQLAAKVASQLHWTRGVAPGMIETRLI